MSFTLAQPSLDHVIVCGKDITGMRAKLAAAGIPTVYGGRHSNRATEMALASFLDGGRIPWQSWLKPEQGVYHVPDELGWGNIGGGALVYRIFLNAVIGLLVVSAFAFLEEIGWRFWMLPRLTEQWNVRKGVLLSAAIWSLWHVPFCTGRDYLSERFAYALGGFVESSRHTGSRSRDWLVLDKNQEYLDRIARTWCAQQLGTICF